MASTYLFMDLGRFGQAYVFEGVNDVIQSNIVKGSKERGCAGK